MRVRRLVQAELQEWGRVGESGGEWGRVGESGGEWAVQKVDETHP